MSVSSSSPPVDIDPFSDDFLRDPFPRLAELRDAGPIVRLERYGIWAAARYEDVFAALMDSEHFISSAGVGITNFHREPPPRPPSIILEADPPLQTRTHKILARALSPAALRSLRDPFEREAEPLVDRLIAADEIQQHDARLRAYPSEAAPVVG